MQTFDTAKSILINMHAACVEIALPMAVKIARGGAAATVAAGAVLSCYMVATQILPLPLAASLMSLSTGMGLVTAAGLGGVGAGVARMRSDGVGLVNSTYCVIGAIMTLAGVQGLAEAAGLISSEHPDITLKAKIATCALLLASCPGAFEGAYRLVRPSRTSPVKTASRDLTLG